MASSSSAACSSASRDSSDDEFVQPRKRRRVHAVLCDSDSDSIEPISSLHSPAAPEMLTKVDELHRRDPTRLWKIGQSFEDLVHARTHSAQYNDSYFDPDGFVVLAHGITTNAHANMLETISIQHAKNVLRVGVNVKTTENRMDVEQYSAERPGNIYAVPVAGWIKSQEQLKAEHK